MGDNGYTLIATPGYGSAIVEAALELTGLPYVVEEIDRDDLGPGSTRLRDINPLGQVPTLLLPSGRPMTESAAMVLHLADVAPEAKLVPTADDPARPAFLHWLIFLVAGLYPTFTFGDVPARWVSGEDGQKELRRKTDSQRKDLWQFVESQIAPNPWFLGQTFSALDIYVAVMNHWRPGKRWFAANCPKLQGIADAALGLETLKQVWARNDFTG